MGDYLRDAITLGGVYVLFSLGLTLSWGVLNILNLAHGNVLVAAALSAYLLTTQVALPMALLLPACMLVGALLGLGLELLVFRPIRARAADEESTQLAVLIGSVAAGALLYAIAERITDGRVRAVDPGTFTVTDYLVAGVRVSNLQLLIVGVSLVLSVLLALLVSRTRHGRALRAIAVDRVTCGLLGVPTARLAAVTMATAGALAGAGGLLLALHLGSVEASMTESLLLKAFAVIIIGGVGSVGGAILGAYLLAGAEVFSVAYLGSGVRDAVVFLVILGLLLLRPQGLFARTAWQRS
ncbi:branched-chain amino acid ABC transporter permease [Acrocarpospora catenulata]|uniref:branched-chain amino acid ABC transporter permease n=1 Tax=Acrocarpospora catenulata TaxID=2836182 RepID=UPI001BD9F686|nr:branched-chain amino acid ABC transporter permease [Acrocarpospora catenulata]